MISLLNIGVIELPYQKQRPGVYSSYSVTSRYATPRSKRFAALVCRAADGLEGKLHTIQSLSEASSLFAGESNAVALGCCKVLLGSGVSKIYFSAAKGPYSAAFSLVEELEGIGVVVTDASSLADLVAARDSVLSSSKNRLERLLFAGAAAPSPAISFAKTLCDERVVITYPAVAIQGAAEPHAVYGAAALAGLLLSSGDPAINLNGAWLNMLESAAKTPEPQVQEMIACGVTVLEQSAGKVEVVRAVTTRSQASGAPDDSLRPINSILIIDDVVMTLRASLKNRLGGLRRAKGTVDCIASQVMVELAAKQDLGIIEQFEPPRVRPHPGDPSVCLVEIAFTAAHIIEQVMITAHVEL